MNASTRPGLDDDWQLSEALTGTTGLTSGGGREFDTPPAPHNSDHMPQSRHVTSPFPRADPTCDIALLLLALAGHHRARAVIPL